MKTGVLLQNLGSPAAPRAAEVRRYLRQFLMDPRVIDLGVVARTLLVQGVIAPFRAPRSAAAYAQVWTEQGSPLLVFSEQLAAALAPLLPGVEVRLAMRYGEPSIREGLLALEAAGCDRILLAPLYPQYASSSTGSSLAEAYRVAAERWNAPNLTVLPPFYAEPEFIAAWTAVGRPVLEDFEPDHVLLSYHGLPERHCRKSDPSGAHCLAHATCCDALLEVNRHCYRAQCFATSRALVPALGLDPARVTTTFQSRLGRDPWIQPYTDQVLLELARAGTRRLAVFCPAFTADCLETLEEIGLRAAADFRAAGGGELRLVPSLNAHPAWVAALATLVRRALPALPPS
jgi:ferrochelatase